MKHAKLTLAALFLYALSSSAAFAVDEHHPDQKDGATQPAAAKDTDKQLQQMKENVGKMQSQLDKSLQTRDPAERQKLLQEHMQTLNENMTAAKNMMGDGQMGGGGMAGMGGGMCGGGSMGGGMMHGGGGSMGCGCMMAGGMLEGRLNQMEKRMDMMQMMMEQSMKKPQAGVRPKK